MEMNWSRWFRCETSFGLLLVPTQPGIYALAEETNASRFDDERRMLAVLEIEETRDLQQSLSRLFASGSRWRNALEQGRCFLRYSVVADALERGAATGALKKWLALQSETENQLWERDSLLREPMEAATVSERAVDRVARTTEYEKVFPVRA